MVDYITEVSNAVTIGNDLSRLSAPAFVKSAVGLNSLYRENLPVGAPTKKFTKEGSLTVASLAQSTAMPADANGEYTETSVTATPAKCAVVSGISVEARAFTSLDVAKLADKQGSAFGRFVSNDIIGLASGLSTVQTATSVLTIDDLMIAQLAIYNSNCPNPEATLQAILGPKAVYNIKKEILQSGATPWSNPNMLSIVGGRPTLDGFMGSIPGLCDVYQTTGFGTTGGDDQQMLIHPVWCLAGVFDTAPKYIITERGSEGFYTEVASYFLYDAFEWNDLAGVQIRSDS